MAETHTISCDAPGCTHKTSKTRQADSLAGWLRREVVDSVNKQMAEGMRDFGSKVIFHLCPQHNAQASALPSPPTHAEVLAFWRQKEENVPGTAPTTGTEITPPRSRPGA